jgi:hypothetical protein
MDQARSIAPIQTRATRGTGQGFGMEASVARIGIFGGALIA